MKIYAAHYKFNNQTEVLSLFTKYFRSLPPPETLKYWSMMLNFNKESNHF